MRLFTREGTNAEVIAAATSMSTGPMADPSSYNAAEALARAISDGPGSTTTPVTPDTALGVSAVYSCVTLVSQAIGTMPLESFAEQGDHAQRIKGTRSSDMLEYQPNAQQAASLVWTTAASHILLRGNAYLAKQRDTRGNIIALWPLHPDRVIPWRDANGAKWFQVMGTDGSIAHYSPAHVWHGIGHSFGVGVEGHSVISVQRRRLQAHMAASEQQTKLFESGLNVKATMKVPYDIDPQGEDAKSLRQDIRTFYSGTSNAGSVLLLEQGMEFNPVSISPHDAQFVEQMGYSAVEVCSWFHVDPSEIGHATQGGGLHYSSDASRDVNFLKKAVRFTKRRIEDDLFIDPDLFGVGSGRYCRFNVDALLEMDAKTRLETYRIGYETGLYTPDDIAALEGRMPRGDAASSMTRQQLDIALAHTAKTTKNGDATP